MDVRMDVCMDVRPELSTKVDEERRGSTVWTGHVASDRSSLRSSVRSSLILASSKPSDASGSTRQCSDLLTTSSRSLATFIDSSNLRGVPTTLLMQNFGEVFAKHEFMVGDYNKSTEVKCLDDFISHDWRSSRRDKFCSLCVLYNGRAATMVSCSVAVALSVAQLTLPLPLPQPPPGGDDLANFYGFWCQLLCPPVFFFTLVYWQLMKRLICGLPRMVFLDKYCIDQSDDAKKEAGILGLAGFLRSTKRLVVLWTPRYFTRLWCTYEVATWLHLEKPLESIMFMPLATGKATVVASITGTIILWLYASGIILLGGQHYMYISVVTGFAVLPWPVHKLRLFIEDIRKLPMQLKDFSLGRAHCHCCEISHRDPRCPELAIPCDRVLVEQTVRSWFGKTPTDFDNHFRFLFGDFVVTRAGPTNKPYWCLVLYGLPFVFRAFDALVALRIRPPNECVRAAIELLAVTFVIIPTAFHLSFYLINQIDRLVGRPGNCCLDVLMTLGITLSIGFIFEILWMAMTVANAMENAGPFVMVLVVETMLTVALFRGDLVRLAGLVGHCKPRTETPPPFVRSGSKPEICEIDELKIITYGEMVSRVRRVYV